MDSAGVVITGLGAISPLGLTVSEMWEGLCAGKCGIGRITAFDPAGFSCKLAGQVPYYKIQQYVPKSYRKAVKLMCRDIELAVIAANEALTDSGFVTKAIDPEKVRTRTCTAFVAIEISAKYARLSRRYYSRHPGAEQQYYLRRDGWAARDK
jgi:3-oxoacyl-(acyl-carrier-protein) synthase